MRFSVITICFNPGQTIWEAIASVRAQRGVEVEYIIVDGGSTDGTREYVSSLNGRIDRSVSEPDRGLYDAINKGIRLATGHMVGLLAFGLRLHDAIFQDDAHCLAMAQYCWH